MSDHLPQKIQNLIGIEVCDGDKDYGTVVDAVAVVSGGNTSWEVVTNRGYSISANQLLNLLAQINYLEKLEQVDEYAQHQVLPPVLPYSQDKKFSWGGAKPYSNGGISNVAIVNGERINISNRFEK